MLLLYFIYDIEKFHFWLARDYIDRKHRREEHYPERRRPPLERWKSHSLAKERRTHLIKLANENYMLLQPFWKFQARIFLINSTSLRSQWTANGSGNGRKKSFQRLFCFPIILLITIGEIWKYAKYTPNTCKTKEKKTSAVNILLQGFTYSSCLVYIIDRCIYNYSESLLLCETRRKEWEAEEEVERKKRVFMSVIKFEIYLDSTSLLF